MARKNNTNEATDNTIYIKMGGTIKSPSFIQPKRGNHPKDKRECYRTSIYQPRLNPKDADKTIKTITGLYDIVEDERYIPGWIKELKESGELPEYINFKSDYPVTVKTRDDNGDEVMFNREDLVSGSEGYFTVKFVVGEDSVGCYLVSFLLTKLSTPKNTYDDCDF